MTNTGAAGAANGLAGVNGAPDGGGTAASEAAFTLERTLPAASVSGSALYSAVQQANALPTTGGSWSEVTTQPYNAETSPYTDPFWSNIGAGFGLVGGRTTALVAGPDGTWYAGTADGGVWTSTDNGANWSPRFDSMPSLSIGALAINPVDGSVWVGRGVANSSQYSYAGSGVYRSILDGATWT
jgi:hypothetical protein